MYKLCFYVPESHKETVKNALFSAGAGTIGAYSHCCWEVLGMGQFMPLTTSTPHLGSHDQLHQVPEWRIELVVPQHNITAALAALTTSHPYETPAFDIIRIEQF